MAKLSKDELLTKITERIEDEDLSIELMEDISDSIDFDSDAMKSEYESKITELEMALEDLKKKYKERFLKGESDIVEEIKEDEEKPEELKEEEVIDVEEI